ncbi:D-glycero-beta-D-manno-heptose-1,7-bisphosphate 7-phosphatase [Taylorella equigenitalis]|uniref:D-glycero-beta-D-manno-heptose 1,7-bisphosphate 7-phosphatase n=1 Tax=Taylorella equigenitalis TaxID=29575 RepID=UPI000BACD82D|nr:D-glycero-beta-D-manno-heptose 1,7-bisphosphate 7-phosphatase [Taylorella equigenitalis]ASY42701.1 D-glycero-beta-D-manno-heptose-1,7-bisphosphate 7-phosphatase [Taylorella equigenitalis]
MKLIVLDRDGVINVDSEDYIKTADDFQLIDGSAQAISKLNLAGYRVVVASNQSGLGRGYFDIHALHQMHRKLQVILKDLGGYIDAFFFCPHTPEDDCLCRKPKPGLFEDIINRYKLDITEHPYFAFGDSLRDLQASATAGFEPILVKTGNGSKTLASESFLEFQDDIGYEVPVFENLLSFVEKYLLADM